MWGKLEVESYGDLLFLILLKVCNNIFQPNLPLILLTDASAVEGLGIVCFHLATQQLKKTQLGEMAILLLTGFTEKASSGADLCIVVSFF